MLTVKMFKILFLVLCMAVPGYAQVIGVHGSYIDSDEIDQLYGIGVLVSFPIGSSFYAISRIAYYPDYAHGTTVGPLQVPLQIDADYATAEAGLGVQKALGEFTFLYSDIGISYLWADAQFSVNGVDTGLEQEDDLGWVVTLGLRTGKNVQGYVELQYRDVDGEVSSDGLPPMLSSLEEFDLKHFAFNVGLAYRW
jgi:hypothetical protein